MSEEQDKRSLQAAALKYDPLNDDTPIIAALGVGHMADKIIESAKSHDIPVVENKQLSDVLAKLSVGDAIPPQLYEAVAQILVFISQKDNDYNKFRF